MDIQAQKLKVKVPEQLSIVGFENTPFSQQCCPALTTVDIPVFAIAEQAGNLVIAKAQPKKASSNKQKSHLEFNPKIKVRESTAPAPIRP